MKDEIKLLFIRALKKKLTQGHSRKGIVCACIFHNCKKYYYFRSLEEISNQIEKSKKYVTRCYTTIVRELELKYQPITLLSLIPRYVSDAGLDETMAILTTDFLKHHNAESHFIGKDPRGVVAAGIYKTAKKFGHRLSQKKIAKITGVTNITLRSRMRELENLI